MQMGDKLDHSSSVKVITLNIIPLIIPEAEAFIVGRCISHSH